MDHTSIDTGDRLSLNQGIFTTTSFGVFIAMRIVDPSDLFRRLDGSYVEVHHDRFLSAPHDHALEGLIGAGVDLLMRHVRRYIDKVTGTGFSGELELIAPTHASAARDDVDDAFKVTVMMCSGLGIWVDPDRASPELRGARPRVSDRRRAIHPGRLRGVSIELVRANDANPVTLPIRSMVCHIGILCQQQAASKCLLRPFLSHLVV
jgi:hypothetical protein